MGDIAVADAPGRVNLIGEHTDYHDGYVLPTVIPQRTRVRVRRRDDGAICASSDAMAGGYERYEPGHESPGRGWLDYLQGVTAMLARRGVNLPGLDVCIESTIPVGAGVSSSAALEVALLRALRELLDLTLDDTTIARLAQAAETDFVGAPVGIMDQMAVSLGREGEALFIDTRTFAVERLRLPGSVEIAVIDSGIPHEHAAGDYRVRRRESFEAARLLGVDRLRDADVSMLLRHAELPPTLARRARHIITENQRVLAAVAALRRGDPDAIGDLFAASHASMRDDYEISTSEIDLLVALGRHRSDVYGARLTGGGFGGAVVYLVHAGAAATAAPAIANAYAAMTGRTATVLVPRAH